MTTLAKVARARKRADVASAAFIAAMVEAVDAGASYQEVADQAGYTRARVYQIVKRAREEAGDE